MVSIAGIVAGSLILVFAVVGSAIVISTSQLKPEVIYSFDAQFGRVDETRALYEGPARPSSGIVNETLIVRMTNFKTEDVRNITVTINAEPKTTNWFALEEAKIGFGNYPFAGEGSKAIIKVLPAGATSSVRFDVRLNTTAIDVNNALSDRSIVHFEITYDGITRPISTVINVRFPPWRP